MHEKQSTDEGHAMVQRLFLPVGRWLPALALAAALATAWPLSSRAAELTRVDALTALTAAVPGERLAAVERLAELGTMADADRLVPRLDDADERVRTEAVTAMWRIWSRSGDTQVDILFKQGMAQMQAGEMAQALATFDEIIRLQPDFAEGWNKRATIRFLMGDLQRSLDDCREVFKRNANHFGALTGAAQIYLRLNDAEHAVEYFERALKVNPNLVGVPEAVATLRAYLERERRTRT
jgi:tetratricopeptide (TPR) repeat protein